MAGGASATMQSAARATAHADGAMSALWAGGARGVARRSRLPRARRGRRVETRRRKKNEMALFRCVARRGDGGLMEVGLWEQGHTRASSRSGTSVARPTQTICTVAARWTRYLQSGRVVPSFSESRKVLWRDSPCA